MRLEIERFGEINNICFLSEPYIQGFGAQACAMADRARLIAKKMLCAQAVAGRARTVRRVKREKARFDLGE